MGKLSDFIDLLWTQVNNGIYVYGGNGENFTSMTEKQRDAFMDKHEVKTTDSKTGDVKYTKDKNIARCKALYAKRVKQGICPILAFDCSGLMYWAGKQVGAITRDISANGIYGKCKKVDKKDVKKGDFCFSHNGKKATHVGMYVGDDIIIECQGRDVGVVTNRLSKTHAFNAFGRFPAFEAEQNEEVATVPVQTAPSESTGKYVVIKGRVTVKDGKQVPQMKVFVRSGNGANYKSVGVAYSKQKFELIEQEDADPHWYKIKFNNTVAWITSNSRYTEVSPCD